MQLKTKPVWEMTDEEFENLITPAVEAARQKRFVKGLPVSYQDKVFCQADNQFIHEYEDGRKFLVELNMETRQYTTLKKLMDKPQLFIFAGPNGAGKSTVSKFFVREETEVFDGDKMQQELETTYPNVSWDKIYEMTSRIFKEKQENAILNREDFAYETNFTFRQNIKIPEKFKAEGYEINMFYIGLESIEKSTDRVNLRKQEGGHDVDSSSIELNFNGGIENIKTFFSFFDRILFIDNPIVTKPKVVLYAELGKIIRQSEILPEWVENQFSEIL